MSEALDAAVDQLLAAKEAGDEEAKAIAAQRVTDLRSAERAGRTSPIGGDAVKVEE